MLLVLNIIVTGLKEIIIACCSYLVTFNIIIYVSLILYAMSILQSFLLFSIKKTQYVPDDMHLCQGIHEINNNPDDNSPPGTQQQQHHEKIIPVPNNVNDNNNNNNSTNNKKQGKKEEEDKKIHVTPSHGVPVALLAKRGQCTYETKARIASQLTSPHGVVRFLIVYNDQLEDGEHLITMMPTKGRNDDNLYDELGLVFVSYESGMGKREKHHYFIIIVIIILFHRLSCFT